MAKLKDITGQVFGRWTVVQFFEHRRRPNGVGQSAYWLCRCECGNTGIISLGSLTCKDEKNRSMSCGCRRKELASERAFKHGENQHNSPEYVAWTSTKQRCTNTNDPYYHRYGGRGIRVCNRWLGDDGFKNFIEDMGRRPTPKHTLDRFPDKDGHYSKENCRWATPSEQARNRITNRLITYLGETLPLVEWAQRYGLSRSRLRDRLENNWPIEKALTEPVQEKYNGWSKR
jgi:hypothetical protein